MKAIALSLPDPSRSLFPLGGVLLLLALVFSFGARGEDPSGGEKPAGKATFLALKCQLCHSVEAADIEAKTQSEKLRGPDLSTAGRDHSGEWLGAFLRRQETLDGMEHKKEFKGTAEELQAIVDWLVALEPPP